MANERRLIDADKLCIKILDGSYYNNADEDVFWEMVQDEPTVEEAVIPVRCRECKNYSNIDVSKGKKLNFHWCNKFQTVTTDTDFCSYGERRCD